MALKRVALPAGRLLLARQVPGESSPWFEADEREPTLSIAARLANALGISLTSLRRGQRKGTLISDDFGNDLAIHVGQPDCGCFASWFAAINETCLVVFPSTTKLQKVTENLLPKLFDIMPTHAFNKLSEIGVVADQPEPLLTAVFETEEERSQGVPG